MSAIKWGEDKAIVYGLDEISTVAKFLLNELGDTSVWLFDAPMGAGKTTLIKELCHSLGVTEVTSSPTFAIVNEYHTDRGDAVYHIDAYRLETHDDLRNIGATDYLHSGDYCFVEWPALFIPFLPEKTARLRIEVDGDQRRLTLLDEATPFIYDPR
ncbi:tRNA (adenosine(37)-N6)-threonylcarbamoyltransferase complex ATPase subunit type 1 TsaE [Porphyromonas levii]|uniref:tRNA (adenosine(37)-N6)-threonylcarbamoyltransferase complex ATPase subunit type 1 TsaE n=1 Tax=Porphyromonas levii TaxID=28114 RepID=UPI000374CEDF|nr:tRNA (adenosine(37)-N6)-threonylcarbamoyltransferase complex ATPase subunit type 1 TsaE [Porphyromonas levii]MBR8714025.1 tRNA threonylcarbamoyladenosine biosynthesis protein TsaE [Porphyromonas levii]MBR8716035.1 tRNA threonylcarbamoyladenosine biosynthesis protein TsaE [Porphyromonas levii]MBR8728564.1 tRNA threonylcarbamoyladenosine biosynthesis protein TsaE [Porphyromonas levii]MBR8729595.1 tRNA threonylcarbamoyladenosine biosynthesis protein TsaE [Porphyromonas levii]MBR8730667.1 tRNA 